MNNDIEFANHFRIVNDFPKEGIKFIDITPVLADDMLYQEAVARMIDLMAKVDFDYVISPEARGFIFGCPIAQRMHKGFVPVRKPNKLPPAVSISKTYTTEYSEDTICIPKSEYYRGKRFIIVDDVYATGGTAKAIKSLVEEQGGIVVGTCVLVNLPYLNNDEVSRVIDVSFKENLSV